MTDATSTYLNRRLRSLDEVRKEGRREKYRARVVQDVKHLVAAYPVLEREIAQVPTAYVLAVADQGFKESIADTATVAVLAVHKFRAVLAARDVALYGDDTEPPEAA